MDKIMKILPVFLFVGLLTGCATRVYLPTYADSPYYGTITLTRDGTEPTASKLHVFVDGDKAASIRSRSYATFSLPTGKHTLTVDWPATASTPENKFPITLKGKEHKYYMVAHSFLASHTIIHARKYRRDIVEIILVNEISPTNALDVIKTLNLSPPHGAYR
jgi:hypothetical protein